MIWVLIPLVAILGGYIIDYQKNKLKWQSENHQQSEEVDDLRKMVLQLKKRVENLEAIATEDPSDISSTGADPLGRIEIDNEGLKNENEQNVARMAKTKGD
ncbi:MAG: hypothetical protein WEA56_03170 [Balneolaceae bacterium]